VAVITIGTYGSIEIKERLDSVLVELNQMLWTDQSARAATRAQLRLQHLL
jgi:hypothetical protein